MEAYEIQFLKSLIITITIELIVLFLLLKTIYKKYQINNKEILFAGILATSLTLPYLWFILPYFLKNEIQFMLIGELSIVIIESVIFYNIFKLKYVNCIILSFVCNLFSFVTGFLIG